jgi:acyl-CoA synthetase (AMP-forming)/AMP-acid ligase II
MQDLVTALAGILGCLAAGAFFVAVVMPRRLLEQARAHDAALAAKDAELQAARAALEAAAKAQLTQVKARQEAAHASDPVDVANDLIGDVVVPSRDR